MPTVVEIEQKKFKNKISKTTKNGRQETNLSAAAVGLEFQNVLKPLQSKDYSHILHCKHKIPL